MPRLSSAVAAHVLDMGMPFAVLGSGDKPHPHHGVVGGCLPPLGVGGVTGCLIPWRYSHKIYLWWLVGRAAGEKPDSDI